MAAQSITSWVAHNGIVESVVLMYVRLFEGGNEVLVYVSLLKTPRKFKELVISDPMSNTVEPKVIVYLPKPNQSISMKR